MSNPRPDSKGATVTTTLAVDGMTCGNCVRHVHEALTALAGVVHADVDLRQKAARVTHDPGRIDAAALVAAVTDAGYDATALPR